MRARRAAAFSLKVINPALLLPPQFEKHMMRNLTHIRNTHWLPQQGMGATLQAQLLMIVVVSRRARPVWADRGAVPARGRAQRARLPAAALLHLAAHGRRQGLYQRFVLRVPPNTAVRSPIAFTDCTVFICAAHSAGHAPPRKKRSN